MLDHLALQVDDPPAAAAFYLDVFASLGVRQAMRLERAEGPVIGLSLADGFPHLWLGPLVDAGRRPVHVALTAPTTTAVDAVHAAAVRAAAEVLHPPRVWPEYHPGYYAVFFRDPAGNNVEAVHHSFTDAG